MDIHSNNPWLQNWFYTTMVSTLGFVAALLYIVSSEPNTYTELLLDGLMLGYFVQLVFVLGVPLALSRVYASASNDE